MNWVVIPILLIMARIVDVTIGTIRIILISKGYRKVAPLLGFAEVFIWIVTVSQIMKGNNNIVYYFAYSFGFATGTYIGMMIESRLSLGMVLVRVITKFEAIDLIQELRDKNYNATSVDGEGRHGEVKILFMIIKRKALNEIIELIRKYNPNSFYTIEDVRDVSGGVFPAVEKGILSSGISLTRPLTKKK